MIIVYMKSNGREDGGWRQWPFITKRSDGALNLKGCSVAGVPFSPLSVSEPFVSLQGSVSFSFLLLNSSSFSIFPLNFFLLCIITIPHLPIFFPRTFRSLISSVEGNGGQYRDDGRCLFRG